MSLFNNKVRDPQKALPVILLAVFLDLIGNGILVPVVPQLLANPDSPYYLLPASVPMGYAYVILGILISIFPLIMFFFTPILGEYSDYVGRRKVMTLSILGTALSFSVFAIGVMTKSLTLLFASRIIGGISSGNLAVAQAAMADITPPKRRASRFGLIAAAYGVGFIIGPVLGGLLSDPGIVSWFDASTPFWFAAFLSIINAVLVSIFMAETNKKKEVASIAWTKAITHIYHAYGMKNVRAIFTTNFLFQSGIALFATFFSVFLIQIFGFDQVAVGYYIGYAGLWLIVSQGIVLRLLTKRYDEISILRVFLFAGAVSILAYYIPTHVVGLLIVGACFALTNGVSMASLPSLISRRTPPERQGEVLGINASVQALAQVAPPMIAGLLAAEITPSAPIYVAGIVIGLAWIFFLITVKRDNTTV